MSSSGPGPRIVQLYLRALAVCSLIAWLSIGSQIQLLIGAHGLLPISPLLAQVRAQVSWHQFPTLFWLWASDRALISVVAAGAAASLFGVMRGGRAWLLVSLPLYVSVSVAAQDFCSFQWDILLVESSFVALFLDARRPSRVALWLPRLLLVKLYVESGIAKALSPVGDWLSGSAMVSYFETSPLPMPLARWLHALPIGVLHASSIAVLAIELIVPFFILGPRRLRLVAFALLGAFQLANALTSNYGFFVPLSLALHLFLLDDDMLPRLFTAPAMLSTPRWQTLGTAAVLALWSTLSVCDGVLLLGNVDSRALLALHDVYDSFRVVGTYHLFASVTTERIEPIIETRVGETWTELTLHDKPGPVDRALPIVQPHQPRVDFQLWFHGLDAQRRLPPYLVRLEALLCASPQTVQPLFVTPLVAHPDAVRFRYARYRFTPPGAHDPWTREMLFTRPEHSCSDEEMGRR